MQSSSGNYWKVPVDSQGKLNRREKITAKNARSNRGQGMHDMIDEERPAGTIYNRPVIRVQRQNQGPERVISCGDKRNHRHD